MADSGGFDAEPSDANAGADAFVPYSLVPTGNTQILSAIGLTGNGFPFPAGTCAEGEVMYGVQSTIQNSFRPHGFCEFKARCGHLLVTTAGVVLVRDGVSVPPGTGAGVCIGGSVGVGANCPADSVVSGLSGTRSGTGQSPRITLLSLEFQTILSMGGTEMGLQSETIGELSDDIGIDEATNCSPGMVAVGFSGTAETVVESYRLHCRSLTIE